MIAQAGDLGVAGYVSQGFAEGAIGYVNYSYALGVEFPVAKVLNAAGYYTEPTPENVAVALLQARITIAPEDPVIHLTQDLTGVYSDTDPRNYQLSSYSYFILPIREAGQFTEDKGRTLGAFAYYAMCQAQQQSASLGYSPIPINLVEASFDQIRKIPGVEAQNINIQECNNPTFSTDGTNTLAQNAPQPQSCDQQGQFQCPDGTGGARFPTQTNNPPVDNGGGGDGGGNTDGGGDGGTNNGDGGNNSGDGGNNNGGGNNGGGNNGGGGNNNSGDGGTNNGGGNNGGGSTDGGSNIGGGSTDGGSNIGGGSTDGGSNAGGGSTDGSSDGGTTTDGSSSGGGTNNGSNSGGGNNGGGGFVDNSGSAADPTINNGNQQQGGVSNGGGQVASGPIQTTTLDRQTTGAPVVLFVSILVLALVVGPALAWRQFSADG